MIPLWAFRGASALKLLPNCITAGLLSSKSQKREAFLFGGSDRSLSNRLKSLEEMGLVEKQPYSNHTRRMNYQLTERGKSLRPVLKAMISWGLKHIPDTQIPEDEPSGP